ncbi:hypothetical protein NDU88_007279, partial [Pleurodeles waltl]
SVAGFPAAPAQVAGRGHDFSGGGQGKAPSYPDLVCPGAPGISQVTPFFRGAPPLRPLGTDLHRAQADRLQVPRAALGVQMPSVDWSGDPLRWVSPHRVFQLLSPGPAGLGPPGQLPRGRSPIKGPISCTSASGPATGLTSPSLGTTTGPGRSLRRGPVRLTLPSHWSPKTTKNQPGSALVHAPVPRDR